MKIVTTIFIWCCIVWSAVAQDFPDSKGTNFWFAVLPNFHNSLEILPFDEALQQEHQLYILISADTITNGVITLRNDAGEERTEPFTITNPQEVYQFRTYTIPYELVGWNQSGLIDYSAMQTETVAEQSIHISTDHEVTVYVANQAPLTSEAFLVLPTDALAEDYVVASYKSDIDWIGPTTPSSNSTPSQFCVVATEDGTDVTLLPTAATFKSPNLEPQTIRLNKGQVYLVQVDPRVTSRSDLTGSLVRASKPVAVFGGHQRAIVPLEQKKMLASRDCLIEQMNPIRTWGKSAYATPLAWSSNEVRTGENLYRVIAAFDSTKVFIDGVQVAEIHAHSYYEGQLTAAMELLTSKPSMVALLKKTSSASGVGLSNDGDPFMMLVPPAEQFMDKYRFVSIQAYRYVLINNKPEPVSTVYTEQWLNVVIPTAAVPSLVLDGNPVNSRDFQQIGTTRFSYAQLRVTDGVHEASADEPFGIYVYGYGEANSYGYIGGMAFRPLDVKPPVIYGTHQCGVFEGIAADSSIGDTRIHSVQIVAGSEQNVNVSIAPYTPPAASVQFSATLIDPYADGSFILEAVDNAKQSVRNTVTIPGFTISAISVTNSPAPVDTSRIFAIGKYVCDTLWIHNYGAFPRTIFRISSSLGSLINQPETPLEIQPGGRVAVVVCRKFDSAGLYSDTLFVWDSCSPRPVYRFVNDVRSDTEPPYTARPGSPCDDPVLAVVGDDRLVDFGIQQSAIRTDLLVNCSVRLLDSSALQYRYQVEVTDKRYDAIYGFEATDSAGNRAVIVDTIPGFTIALNNSPDWFSSNPPWSEEIGDMVCDTIWLSNYGLFPQVITDILLRVNIRFSVPQHQLPISVYPGTSVPLLVCYQPAAVTGVPDTDTLELFDECIAKGIELLGNGVPAYLSGSSRCDVTVTTKVISPSSAVQVYPAPADDHLHLFVPGSAVQTTARVLDVTGALIARLTLQPDGEQRYLADVSDLPGGLFLLQITTNTGLVTKPLIIR